MTKLKNAKLESWAAAGGRLRIPMRQRHKLPVLFPYMRAQGKEGIQITALFYLLILLSLPFITLKVVENALQPRGPYLTQGTVVFPTIDVSISRTPIPLAIYGVPGTSTHTVTPSVTPTPDAPWKEGSPCFTCGVVEDSVLITPRPIYASEGAFGGDGRRFVPSPMPWIVPAPVSYNLPGGSSIVILSASGSFSDYDLPTMVFPTYVFPTATRGVILYATQTPFIITATQTSTFLPTETPTLFPTVSATPSDTPSETGTAVLVYSPTATQTASETPTLSPTSEVTIEYVEGE